MSEIELPEDASMKTYQRYVHDLESMHGWLDVDLVHNCFLMGEEVGELFKAVRRYEKLFDQSEAAPATLAERKTDVAHELVDVLNYLLAIAHRLAHQMDGGLSAASVKGEGSTFTLTLPCR